MLKIDLLGDFRILEDGRPLTTLSAARVQSLLAYLLVNRHAPQPRHHLAFLFWPDSTEKQALTNLRNLIHLLRQALPNADRYLSTTQTAVQWRTDAPYTLDVAEFEDALAGAHRAGSDEARVAALRRTQALYHGDLLPKFYDAWITPERARLHAQFVGCLDRLLGYLTAREDYPEARTVAERLLQADPLREESYRVLMRLHAAHQDRAGALRVYHACARVLEQELQVAPGPTTQALYQELLDLPPESPATHPALPPTGGHSPFVGRDGEVRRLWADWQQVTQGHSRFVLVTGEAGIGKTRLVEEVRVRAARQGSLTARTRAYATTGTLAYAPLVEWFQDPALYRHLQRLDAVWRSEMARLLPTLLVQFPETPPPDPHLEGWQRQRFFEALARALLAAQQPLFLVCDDLQWADQETLDFLHYLLMRYPDAPLLVVGTARAEARDEDHPLYAWQAALARDQRLREIELGPLSFAETVDLGAAVAGYALDQALADRLYAETEGLPLFVVEAVRAGLLAQVEQPQSSAVARVEDATLPAAVRAVIQLRLAQLAPETRDLLGLAAVIGREFTFDVLGRAGNIDEMALMQRLDELWRRRIIREQGAHAYDFTHDKLREVAYAALGPIQRKHLHQRVAAVFAALSGADRAARAGQLAFHYERGGMAAEASHAYVTAAEAARRVYANAEAIRQYRNAIRLWPSAQAAEIPDDAPDAPSLADLHETLGDVLQMTGQVDAARAAFEQALALRSGAEHVARAGLLRKIGKTWELQVDYVRARDQYTLAEQALRSAPAPGTSTQDMARQQAWLQIQLERIWVCYWLNEWQEAGRLEGEVAPLVARDGTPDQQINFYLALASTAARRDRYAPSPEAVAWSRRALAVAQTLDDAGQVAWASFLLGFMLLWHGDLSEAAELLETALHLAQARGDVVLRARCLTYLTIVARKQGELERTCTLVERSLEAALAAHMAEYTATAHANRAWCAWRAGDVDATLEHTGQALELWGGLPKGHSSCAFQWTALWPRLSALVDRNDLAAAVACVEALLDPAQQALPDSLADRLMQALRTWAKGDTTQTRTHLTVALDVAHRWSYL
jgi:DNA-binding SARP family transcriptional activator